MGRGWQEFEEKIKDRRRVYVKRVGDASMYVALKASEDAPNGWSLQLSRSGINALPPVIDGPRIVGLITASAISASGYDYAERQHDEELRHASLQPLQRGYTDFGSSGTQKQRYTQGYALAKDSSPKFASEYLSRQFELADRRARIIKILRGA